MWRGEVVCKGDRQGGVEGRATGAGFAFSLRTDQLLWLVTIHPRGPTYVESLPYSFVGKCILPFRTLYISCVL